MHFLSSRGGLYALEATYAFPGATSPAIARVAGRPRASPAAALCRRAPATKRQPPSARATCPATAPSPDRARACGPTLLTCAGPAPAVGLLAEIRRLLFLAAMPRRARAAPRRHSRHAGPCRRPLLPPRGALPPPARRLLPCPHTLAPRRR